jgi:transposase-like protein
MASTIENHSERVICPECGVENSVEVITEYDTEDTDLYIDVASYQDCDKCHYQFKAKDLNDVES